jgi:hypothetical protein
MRAREWHLDRIEELKFQKIKKIDEYNRYNLLLIAILSLATAFFIFGLSAQTFEYRRMTVILFGILIILIVFAIWFSNRKGPGINEEDLLVQRNYDAILGRER